MLNYRNVYLEYINLKKINSSPEISSIFNQTLNFKLVFQTKVIGIIILIFFFK